MQHLVQWMTRRVLSGPPRQRLPLSIEVRDDPVSICGQDRIGDFAVEVTHRGLTRRINILADKALLSAFTENGHAVTPRHVRAAVRDSEFATTSSEADAIRRAVLDITEQITTRVSVVIAQHRNGTNNRL